MTLFSDVRRRDLEEAAGAPSWKKTDVGYELMHKGSLATLTKKGKEWVLAHQGREKGLGRKASFDAAERALQGLGEAEEPLVLKPVDKTSWRDEGPRYGVDVQKVKKGMTVFLARDLEDGWESGPLDNWSQVIASLEEKTKRKVKVEGVLM